MSDEKTPPAEAPAKKPVVEPAHKPDLDFAANLQRLSADKARREKLDKEPYVQELQARITELEAQLALVGEGDSKRKK